MKCLLRAVIPLTIKFFKPSIFVKYACFAILWSLCVTRTLPCHCYAKATIAFRKSLRHLKKLGYIYACLLGVVNGEKGNYLTWLLCSMSGITQYCSCLLFIHV